MAGRFTRTADTGSNVRVLEGESQLAPTKVERERDFHNKVYTESTRRRIWGFYDTNSASSDHFKELVRGSGGLQGARVLEIGAGLTTQAFWMVEEGAHVTGIDISDVVVEKVRRARASWACRTAATSRSWTPRISASSRRASTWCAGTASSTTST